MKKSFLLAATVCAALTSGATRLHAQAQYQEIPLKNTNPAFVLWFLDPERQSEPVEFAASRIAARRAGMIEEKRMPKTGALPAGVESVARVEATNSILAKGTPEGIAALQRIVGRLDAPLKTVEVEAILVEGKSADLAQFAIDFSTSRRANLSGAVPPSWKPGDRAPENAMAIGFARPDYLTTLRTMQGLKRARTLMTPRVSALNYLFAADVRRNAAPLTVEASRDGLLPATKIFVVTTTGLTVSPEIKNDGSVTLTIASPISRGLMRAKGSNANEPDETTWTSLAEPRTVSATLKDGETVAITNELNFPRVDVPPPAPALDGPLSVEGAKKPREAKPGKGRAWILFVTPRITPLASRE